MIVINELNLVILTTYVEILNNKNSYKIEDLFEVQKVLYNHVPDLEVDVDSINVYEWLKYFSTLGYFTISKNEIIFNDKTKEISERAESILNHNRETFSEDLKKIYQIKQNNAQQRILLKKGI